MEIVIRFREGAQVRDDRKRPDDHRFTLVDRMAIISQVQTLIEERFGENGEKIIGPSLSAATFVPPLPTERRGHVGGRPANGRPIRSCSKATTSCSRQGYLRVDPAGQFGIVADQPAGGRLPGRRLRSFRRRSALAGGTR